MTEKRLIGRTVGARIVSLAQPQALDWLPRRGPFGATLASYASLHSLGRAAIYWAIRGLQLSPDTIVKMPAYHCGVEVQAVLDAGLQVEFYGIRPDLTIDLDDLERRLVARPGPVFVIHYFGFGQPDVAAVDQMCGRLGLPWVEDCARAFFQPPGPAAGWLCSAGHLQLVQDTSFDRGWGTSGEPRAIDRAEAAVRAATAGTLLFTVLSLLPERNHSLLSERNHWRAGRRLDHQSV